VQTYSDTDPDDDEDPTSDQLAPAPEAIFESFANLQSQQREANTGSSDRHCGDDEIDAIGAESETDDQVVDAQYTPDQDEAPVVQLRPLGFGSIGEQSSHNGVGTGETEQPAGHGCTDCGQVMGQGLTDREPKKRHDSFKQAEDQCDPEAKLPVHTGDAESRRSGEVVQAH
jgi:hypothetical protein